MQSMLTMPGVTDMNRSVGFYRDTLGLRMTFQSRGWSTFDVGGNTLALHGVASPAGGGLPPSEGVTAGTATVGFNVSDIEKVHRTLVDRGARFVMPPTKREAEGIFLAVLLDPDGLAISIAQEIGRADAISPEGR